MTGHSRHTANASQSYTFASQAMKRPLNLTGHCLPLMELSLLGFINFERNKLPSFFS